MQSEYRADLAVLQDAVIGLWWGIEMVRNGCPAVIDALTGLCGPPVAKAAGIGAGSYRSTYIEENLAWKTQHRLMMEAISLKMLGYGTTTGTASNPK